MRIKVLICIDWFLPAYKAGGPIQSIANLVNHTKEDFDYYIATSNSDLYAPLDLPKTILNSWQDRVGYKIIYIDPAHQTLKFYKSLFLVENFDVVYFNSLFSKNFTLLPLFLFKNQPIRKVLAPRGMLGQGALAIKPTKKKIFLKGFKILNLHKKVIWHVTAHSEMAEVKQHFGKGAKVLFAPNLSAKVTQWPTPKLKKTNGLNLFFLSRIAVKKNLLAALDYLNDINSSYKVHMSIIGPKDELEYWKTCEQKIKQLPKHISVSYEGAIPNKDIFKKLKAQHVLLLPTQHENFGHVIMESWQNGCPVIISDQTPWKGLKRNKLGFDLALAERQAFIAAIEFFCAMEEEVFQTWSSASVKFFKKFTENPQLIEQNKALFLGTTI